MAAVTYFNSGLVILQREAETGLSFQDTLGDGSYLSYQGCNNSGANAPGIGVQLSSVYLTASEIGAGKLRPEAWTELDQNGDARHPQGSAVLSSLGYVSRTSGDTSWQPGEGTDNGRASSGGVEGTGASALFSLQPDDPLDNNDSVYLVVADQNAADGEVMDTATGVVNVTGGPVENGDMVWGVLPT